MSLKSLLDNLKLQRDNLKNNLKTKGVSIPEEYSRFDQLVPKVLEIQGGEGMNTNDATAIEQHILKGKTAYARGEKITGSIETYTGSNNFVPSTNKTEIQTARKYLENNLFILGDANLIPSNIVEGFTIFGVEGAAVAGGFNTSDANASAQDILAGKIAYNRDGRVVGTLATYDKNIENINNLDINETTDFVVHPSSSSQRLTTSGTKVTQNIVVQGDENLKPENIISGATIFGVQGSATGGEDSDDCDATNYTIMKDRTALVKGFKVTGSLDLSMLPSLTAGGTNG